MEYIKYGINGCICKKVYIGKFQPQKLRNEAKETKIFVIIFEVSFRISSLPNTGIFRVIRQVVVPESLQPRAHYAMIYDLTRMYILCLVLVFSLVESFLILK